MEGGNIKKERILFGEFDAAMRMMVQYEWKEKGWRSAVQLDGVGSHCSLFELLDSHAQIGFIWYGIEGTVGLCHDLCACSYDRFNWKMQLPLGENQLHGSPSSCSPSEKVVAGHPESLSSGSNLVSNYTLFRHAAQVLSQAACMLCSSAHNLIAHLHMNTGHVGQETR